MRGRDVQRSTFNVCSRRTDEMSQSRGVLLPGCQSVLPVPDCNQKPPRTRRPTILVYIDAGRPFRSIRKIWTFSIYRSPHKSLLRFCLSRPAKTKRHHGQSSAPCPSERCGRSSPSATRQAWLLPGSQERALCLRETPRHRTLRCHG